MIPSADDATGSRRGWRADFFAPVASFRDPLFPGMTHGLPVPPPSTVRGLLAAASGEDVENLPVGLASWPQGSGVDAETYHPIAADGSNPAFSGRVRAVKGGMTIRDRPFLTGVRLTVWMTGPDGDRLATALRRPRWPLRLGRSQDIVHPLGLHRTRLEAADEAVVGHALAPAGGHDAPQATLHRMASSISPDRLATRLTEILWCEESAGIHQVTGAFRDEDGQAVWLLAP
ncbi:CRISPR-associated protein Cas5 [Streptomyces sp. WMMB 322]|uniref:CRISPR-associated protein Cas5 n=1 Tax=Streptomyces sp. WMMB 322 TaxID=1286821 RepID=UPI0006E1E664|nr:CRISPR-associated protein Cas5 [Streptomyces sp. WMMB 322]SCK12551.1 CRISPR-associated protein, Cas5t family [Streptomyces sp. WMMB 322]